MHLPLWYARQDDWVSGTKALVESELHPDCLSD